MGLGGIAFELDKDLLSTTYRFLIHLAYHGWGCGRYSVIHHFVDLKYTACHLTYIVLLTNALREISRVAYQLRG